MSAIAEVAAAVPAGGTIVEVGSLYGLSSWIWAKNAPSARIVCIDVWKHKPWVNRVRDEFGAPDLSLDAFLHNVRDCPNIQAIRGFSPDCAKDWIDEIDVYFDDATHVNPGLRNNIDFWSQHIRPGGIACGHDYSSRWPDVIHESERLAAVWCTSVSVRGAVWFVTKPR